RSEGEHDKTRQSESRSEGEHDKTRQSESRSKGEHDKTRQSESRSEDEHDKTRQSESRSEGEHYKTRQSDKTCPKDWIQFQESCYFFYNLNSPWKTWDQSQQLCQSNKSDLVVISSLEEQRFVKNTIKYYLDVYHGYWIGLQKVNNNWIWVDGSPDTLGQYYVSDGSGIKTQLFRFGYTFVFLHLQFFAKLKKL
uniref:C-type lectin domain-containing protein n=1 Tax=Oryzias latipes TaxID=8090 RepID=A0A3P9IF31_ORYLA